MADSLDSLQIELKSSSQSAVQSINTLISKLGALSGALAGVDTGKISSLAGSVSQLSSAMQGMNAIKTTDFTRLSRNLNSISNISGSTLTTASNNIVQFAKSLESLKNVSISPSAQQITELASSIRVLGLKSATNAISNIPQLSTALVGLMQSLSGAPTVSRNVIDLTNALAQLSSANGRVTSTSTTNKAKSFFDTLTSGSNMSTKSVKSLAYYFGKLYANFFIVFRLFRKLGEAIDLSSQLTELQNVVDVTFGDMASRLDNMAQTSIQDFGMSELTLKKIASRYQAMGSAMGITDNAVKKSTEYLSSQNAIYDDTASTMADVSIQLTKLTADMASFYDVSQSDVAEDLQSVFTGMTRPLRQYGLDLTQATLQEWALSQGMNANIQTMTQAEKTMLRYQYVMAHTTNAMGDFKRTSDTWANQIRILKQNFQQLAIVIGNTLVQAFKPFVKALNQVMAKVIQFAQTVYNALGKIFGWKMEIGSSGVTDELYGAEDATGGIEDNLGGASDNAKKLKDNLLGIDELNIISPDIEDTSGSGSNLGNLGGALDDMEIAEETTESLFDKIKSNISSLFELGRWISNAIAEAIEGIDWEKIYKKADRFGIGLANFLNGLITPRLFGDLGDLIANSLNTVLHTLDSFGDTFSWHNFGLSLATGLNHFFQSFNFGLLADTINVWANGILDTMIVFLQKTDWKMIGEQIGTFLARLDFFAIGKKVGKAIWEAINAGVELFSGMFSVAPFETIIVSLAAIPTLVKSIIGLGISKKIASLVGSIYTLGKAIGGSNDAMLSLGLGGTTALGVINSLRKGIDKFSIGLALGVKPTNALYEGFKAIGGTLGGVQGALVGLTSAFAEFFIFKNELQELYEGTQGWGEALLSLIPTIAVVGTSLTAVLGFPTGVIATAIIGITGAVVGMKEAFDNVEARNLSESIKDALSGGSYNLIDAIGSIKDGVVEIGDSFSTVEEKAVAFDNARQKVDELIFEISKIGTQLDAGVIDTEEATTQLANLYGQLADAISIKLSSAEDVILSYFGENSTVSKALEAQGKDVAFLRQSVVEDMSVSQQKVYDLSQELNSLLSDPVSNASRIEEIKNQLENINGGFDETSAIVEDFSIMLDNNSLDWSEFLQEDSFDIESIQGMIKDLKLSVDDAYVKVDESSKEVNEALNQIADEQTRQNLKNAMNAGMDGVKGSIAEKATQITDAMQTDVIGGLNKVIEDAQSDWDDLSWANKFFKYNNNENEYIKSQVDAYKSAVVDPLSEEIEQGFEEIGIEGAGWASDACDELIKGLFDTTALNEEGTVFSTELKGEYQRIIENSINGLQETTKSKHRDMGKWGAEGYAEGFDSAIIIDAVSQAIQDGIDAGDMAQQTGSPAQKYIDMAQWAVLGYAQGIEENKETAITSIRTWFEEMMAIFSGEDGNSPFEGLKIAWENFTIWWSKEATPTWMTTQVEPVFAMEKWLTLAESIKKSIKQRWDEMSKQWQVDINTWWNNYVASWFTLDKWTKMLEVIPTAFRTAFKQAGNVAIDALNHVLDGVEQMVNSVIDAMSELASALGQVEGIDFSFSASHISVGRIPHFATGGFPEDGLFYANHNELVGSFNGKNAVVNNTQIVEGIATGIERVIVSTLTPYLEDIADSSRTTANKEFDIDIDYKQMSREIKRSGFAF